MAACAHNPGKMKGKCPPASVAKEFNQADKGTAMLRKATSKGGKRHG